MEKAIFKLKDIAEQIMKEYAYIEREKVGIWFMEGDYLNSKVEIELEEDIDYELHYFLKKDRDETLTKHELFVFLHELSHIIILEMLRKEKGIETVKEYLDKYKKDILNLERRAKVGKWDTEKIQIEYEKIEFEEKTDYIAKLLFDQYVKNIAS